MINLNHLAIILYSLDRERTRSWSGESCDPRGNMEEGAELAEVKHQSRRARAPVLLLAHLEVLGWWRHHFYRLPWVFTFVGLFLAVLDVKL